MATPAQIDANRANAQYSTGPASPEGKAVTRLNAVKHGIYARIQFLPGEDRELFAALAADYQQQWNPQTADEILLVDTLIRNDWYMRRFDRIESLVIEDALDPTLPSERALAKLYGTAAGKNNPLSNLKKAQAAAQRDWYNACKQLQLLRKLRSDLEAARMEVAMYLDSAQTDATIQRAFESAETNPISPSMPSPRAAFLAAYADKEGRPVIK